MSNFVKKIRIDRIADDLWTLVRIPSPTGNERACATAYADMLKRAGAQVSLHKTKPASPSVIGRLKGNRPGPTLQLAGHSDHIDVPHAAPSRSSRIISGRGSGDMKNGLAAILETVRVLSENGCDFPGEILVTVYGLHEAPAGDSSALLELVKKGITGDAAIVAETQHSTEGKIIVAGKGQAIWNLSLRRNGQPCHELNYKNKNPDLLSAILKITEAIIKENKRLQRAGGYQGVCTPESLFVGQMHYGDFYNRVPSLCTMQGTRRWHPDVTFAKVRKMLEKLVASVRLPKDITASVQCSCVGEAYMVDKHEDIVRAQKKAIETITGTKARYAGISIVVDANRLVPFGKTPTVLCGFDNAWAHADREYVRLDKILTSTRIMMLTALQYLNTTSRRPR